MVPTIPGKNFNHISAWAAGVPLPMCLNAALDIPDPIPFYKNAGPNKIDPATIPSMDALLDATVENYKWVIHRLVLIGNITDALYQEYAPRPFLSTLIDECIHRAQDVRDWNYRPDYRDVTLFGLNTVADSLAAIKKVVFDDKKVSMGDLVQAMRNNWQGHEKLRRMCLEAPKFGNDDDYVDLLSLEFARRVSEETMKCRTNLGSPVIPDGTASTAWWSFGRVCAATADGRLAGAVGSLVNHSERRLTLAEAEDFVKEYFREFPGVKNCAERETCSTSPIVLHNMTNNAIPDLLQSILDNPNHYYYNQ